jgi:hypothetical protein
MSPRKESTRLAACCFLGLLALSLASSAAADEKAPLGPLIAGGREAVIDKISEIFGRYYPDPALTEKMVAQLKQEEAAGAFDRYTDMAAFASRLTKDMRAISKDDHITVWPYEPLPEDLAAETRLGSPGDNYGFKKVELLPGNIGYIRMTYWANPRMAAPTAIAAMNFVAHCDALIFDLRSNGGGDDIMADFLSSYLFSERTHISDILVPSEGRLQQDWTLEWVPGPRLPDVPVCILLNRLSYSASEAFAFRLQQCGRALVVGERTRGGAHAVKYMSFPEVGVNIRVPYTTDVKPGTQESYIEGIMPDIPASSESALSAAAVRAVSDILASEPDKSNRFALEWALASYKVELEPVVLDPAALGKFAGSYGDAKVILACERLYLQRKDRRKQALVPLGDDDFKFADPDLAHYRVKFTRDLKNRIDGLFIHDGDGDSYPPMKRAR